MPKIIPMCGLAQYKGVWVNFRDAFPKRGTFTIQRKNSETPQSQWSHGRFSGHPSDTHNPDFIEYAKTAQWTPSQFQSRHVSGYSVFYKPWD